MIQCVANCHEWKRAYARNGITLRCANTDSVNGWAEILTRFGDVEAGIRPTCSFTSDAGG